MDLDVDAAGNPERLIFRDAVGAARRSVGEGWDSVENVQERDEEAWRAVKRRGPGRDPRISSLSRRAPGQPVMLAEALAVMSAIMIDDWPFRGPRALAKLLSAVLASGLALASYGGFRVSESGVSMNAAVAMDVLHLVIDAFVAEEQKAQGVILKQKRLFGEEQQSEPR
eukprot:3529911-Pyramimonas_sp.AAC.1